MTEELPPTHLRRDTPTSRTQAPCSKSPWAVSKPFLPELRLGLGGPHVLFCLARLSSQRWSLKATSCFPSSLCSGQALPWPAMPSPSRDAPHSSSQDHQFWVPLLRRGSEAVLWGSRAASEHPTMHSQTGLCVAGTPACPISPKHRTLFPRFPWPWRQNPGSPQLPPGGLQPSLTQPRLQPLQADPREEGGIERKHREQNSLGTGSQTTNRGSPKHSDLRASAKHQNAGRRKPSRTHPARGALSSHL